MKVVVHSIVNKYMLCATVIQSNALLRFRFERPLNLEYVQPGLEISVLQCEFSRLTHVINCRRVLETHVMCEKKPSRPMLA